MASDRKLKAIGVTFSGAADEVRGRVEHIHRWLEQYAEVGLQRGWNVTIHTSASQSARVSAKALTRAIDRATNGAPFLLMAIGTDPERPVSTFTWLADQPFPPGTTQLSFDGSLEAPAVLNLEEWRELALALATSSMATQGGVSTPAMPEQYRSTMTEMERRAIGLGPNGLKRYLRQPHWAVWLTSGHLEVLGGRDRVAREAPVYRALQRGSGLWLELTADPLDIPDATWARWEEYLGPLVPTEEAVRQADPPQPRTAPVDRPTVADSYADFVGPALPAKWLPTGYDSLGIHVHLSRAPSAKAAQALNRAVWAWYEAGAHGGFPGGGFHDLVGPWWDPSAAHWTVDLGFADAEASTNDLLQRLAGWSATWDTPVRVVQFGIETDS